LKPEIEMKPRIYKALLPFIFAFFLLFAMLFLLQRTTVLAKTAPNSSETIQAGLDYLKSQQQADGGITGFSGVSDPDTTARSVMAFVTAKTQVSGFVSSDGKSMLDYLAAQAIGFTHDVTGTLFPGRAGILLSAISMAGENPSTFGGMDLPAELEASFQPDTGVYSTTAKADFSSGSASDQNQAWAILGLSLAGKSVPESAVTFLVQSQAADGSWGFGDPDTTALVMTALVASHNDTSQSETIQKAVQYFRDTQLPSGGWRPSWDTDPLNADSTGWAIQALVSAGEDVRDQSWSAQAANPMDALASLQKPDGSIGGTYANAYGTAEAILGLSGIPLVNLGLGNATQRAGLVVFYGGDSFFTKCISFTGSTMSGMELLGQSGLHVETATNPSQGTAVCKIENTGSSASDCFGSMPDYWSYWQLAPSGWEYSATGADMSQVQDGGVNAWSWGTGNPPPVITYQNICEGVAIVLPTSTVTSPAPTASIAPSQTKTQAPATVTAIPTPLPEPSQGTPTSYIVYAVIVLVLGGLTIILLRSRRK
jgi:Prenyltransferase and squalene oxidase repeat